MDSDGNSQVSSSKKRLALAELTCNWQLKHGNSRKFHGARGILMYLNLALDNDRVGTDCKYQFRNLVRSDRYLAN